jgi:hypothetical protein
LVFFSPQRKKLFEDAYLEMPNATDSEPPQLPRLGRFKWLILDLWASLRPCPSTFAFVPSEIGFIRQSLEGSQELLRLPRPDPAQISVIRRNLGKCQSIIERKWLNRSRWKGQWKGQSYKNGRVSPIKMTIWPFT